MNLIIDVGNTLVKLAVFDKNTMLHSESFERELFFEKSQSIFKQLTKIDWSIIAAVGFLKEKDIAAISEKSKLHIVDYTTKTPFKNKYGTPKTLGVDRVALVAAAFYLKPNENVLIIDAGSCITYDILTAKGDYLGGAISPGIHMRYRALHEQTAKLPLLALDGSTNLIGDSTPNSIHSGVVHGVLAEIDGIINQYRIPFEDLTVILTGGDAQFLSKRLKNTIFADSNFLLKGLNFLLEYNKQ